MPLGQVKPTYLLLPTAMTRRHLTGGIHMSATATAALWAGRVRRLIVGHASGLRA
jgi:hypothetical protein